jgi:hypothetical protein
VVSAGSPRLFPVAQEQLTSDDYYTPSWLFERMGITFDLDVCAPPGGVPWIPAARFYTQEDDGLASEWSGRVWMNPPFSAPEPWISKFIAHSHGVALVPMSNGRWFHTLWGHARGIVLVAAFGDECVAAISRLGVVRRIA